MNKGIDVSEHNGVIDWGKVKNAGIDFAMIRAGYGAGNIDDEFKRNIKACNSIGIPCGVYWFSYAYTPEMAAREANFCLNAVKPYKLEYPIAFDFEYDSIRYAKEKGISINKTMASAIAVSFCKTIEKAKYYAINYSNLDYLSNYFNSDLNKYGLWLAAWNNAANPPKDCQIWQYSSSGKVNGISGNVDMNKGYVDFPKVIKEAGLNNLGTGKQETTKETYYDKALKWAVENGITDGTKPEAYATRAQVVTMLKRYHDKFYKK